MHYVMFSGGQIPYFFPQRAMISQEYSLSQAPAPTNTSSLRPAIHPSICAHSSSDARMKVWKAKYPSLYGSLMPRPKSFPPYSVVAALSLVGVWAPCRVHDSHRGVSFGFSIRLCPSPLVELLRPLIKSEPSDKSFWDIEPEATISKALHLSINAFCKT